MDMKRTGWKQLALSVAGAFVCRISVMGCYPLVPAFFAAVYLEEQGRWLLSVGMLAGMAAFLPISVNCKVCDVPVGHHDRCAYVRMGGKALLCRCCGDCRIGRDACALGVWRNI